MQTKYKLHNLKMDTSIRLFSVLPIVTCFLRGVKSDQILTSPCVTDWGKWGGWEYCSDGMYATGFQLRTQPPQGTFRDDRGMTGIRLMCNPYGKKTDQHAIQSGIDKEGEWGTKYFCPEGLMTGFQMRSEKYQSPFLDDTAANNLRMFCDGDKVSYQEGDGTASGKWTDKQLCQPKEAICGINTQIDNSDSWDKTGLNNVMMKCCSIPHPVKTCTPVTTWKLLVTCGILDTTKTADTDTTTCKYSRKVGISYEDGINKDTINLNEYIGYGLTHMKTQFHTKFLRHAAEQTTDSDNAKSYWSVNSSRICLGVCFPRHRFYHRSKEEF